MFDLDNFKRYNDLYGHLEGDKVLKKDRRDRQDIRSGYNVDSGYRYGGDEFAVLLIGASVDQALTIAERIRSSIEQAGFQDITVSIGLSNSEITSTWRSLSNPLMMRCIWPSIRVGIEFIRISPDLI